MAAPAFAENELDTRVVAGGGQLQFDPAEIAALGM
jgi:hypothetical protein